MDGCSVLFQGREGTPQTKDAPEIQGTVHRITNATERDVTFIFQTAAGENKIGPISDGKQVIIPGSAILVRMQLDNEPLANHFKPGDNYIVFHDQEHSRLTKANNKAGNPLLQLAVPGNTDTSMVFAHKPTDLPPVRLDISMNAVEFHIGGTVHQITNLTNVTAVFVFSDGKVGLPKTFEPVPNAEHQVIQGPALLVRIICEGYTRPFRPRDKYTVSTDQTNSSLTMVKDNAGQVTLKLVVPGNAQSPMVFVSE